jgi:thiol-disulfide isomerase/thioredoxin
MKAKLMRFISLVAAILCIPTFSYATITSLNPALDSDCQKLTTPHTVLIIHATWCPCCQEFMPVITAVSDLPQYKSWSFYEITDDDGKPVCGKTPEYVPVSFIKNINGQESTFVGYKDEEALKKTLDTADTTPMYLLAKKIS